MTLECPGCGYMDCYEYAGHAYCRGCGHSWKTYLPLVDKHDLFLIAAVVVFVGTMVILIWRSSP